MITAFATLMCVLKKGSMNGFGLMLFGSIDYFFIYAIAQVIKNGGCS